jgi:hypothetical protein
MFTPQAGIFALGTSSHAYLEFDLAGPTKWREFASTISPSVEDLRRLREMQHPAA